MHVVAVGGSPGDLFGGAVSHSSLARTGVIPVTPHLTILSFGPGRHRVPSCPALRMKGALLQMTVLLHAACASSLHVPSRWSDAHCAAGSRRWIEMIRSKTICPLAKPEDTKVHISRRRASPQRHGASAAQRLNASAPLAGGRLHLRSTELRGPAGWRRRRRRQRGARAASTSC